MARKGLAFADEMHEAGVCMQYNNISSLINEINILLKNTPLQNKEMAITQRKNYLKWYENL